MSLFCYSTNCSRGCCNWYGYCPELYSTYSYDSYYTKCWNYYSSSTGGTIGGAIGGAIAGVIILIIIICVCYRRRQQAAL